MHVADTVFFAMGGNPRNCGGDSSEYGGKNDDRNRTLTGNNLISSSCSHLLQILLTHGAITLFHGSCSGGGRGGFREVLSGTVGGVSEQNMTP